MNNDFEPFGYFRATAFGWEDRAARALKRRVRDERESAGIPAIEACEI